MTVCIAAACDNGDRIVTATDGLLSLGDVTAGDTIPGKMLWYKDWQFMYAGTPANFSLVVEEVERTGMNDHEALSRPNVQETVRAAYRKFCARYSSSDALDPFDMTMDEFKEHGLAFFGEEFHGDLLRRIKDKAALLGEQLLVTGWGHAPHAVMIWEFGSLGEWLHTAAGFAAIGSGAPMAQTMLLLLGQGRHRTLSETLFNVACAKFYAEKSGGMDVGQNTAMYVSRKRSAEDDKEKICGAFVGFEDMDELRSLWEQHVKPRIPDEVRVKISSIGARVNRGVLGVKDMVDHVNAAKRLYEKRLKVMATTAPDPQPTTAAPSPQPPSPVSPGEKNES